MPGPGGRNFQKKLRWVISGENAVTMLKYQFQNIFWCSCE